LIFEDNEKEISFPAFAGYYYSLRIFFSASPKLINFMEYDDFKGLITGF